MSRSNDCDSFLAGVSLYSLPCYNANIFDKVFSINFKCFHHQKLLQKQIGTCINLHFIVFGKDVPRVHHFGRIRSFCLVSGGSSREASEWNQTVALSNLRKYVWIKSSVTIVLIIDLIVVVPGWIFMPIFLRMRKVIERMSFLMANKRSGVHFDSNERILSLCIFNNNNNLSLLLLAHVVIGLLTPSPIPFSLPLSTPYYIE